MSILSFNEIVDVLILTFALGYIFSDMIRKPKNFDFLGSDFNDFKYAALIVTPAVLLHELAHKGVGIYFGYDSIFVPNGYNKTFAELNSVEKNEISHRSEAFKRLIIFLDKQKYL